MADDTTTQESAEPVETDEATEQEAKGDVPPEVKRALQKANKEAETLRLKLKEFEDRDKTEVEKIAERAKLAEERAAKAESEALRFRIANEYKLSQEDALALEHVASEEGMRTVADRLRASAESGKRPAPPARKLASGSSGADGATTGRERAAAALRQMRGGN